MATPRPKAHERRSTERRCILTGEVKPKEALIRFAVGPDGVLVPDLEERLPGRGLWLQAGGDMMRRAAAGDAFSRAARRQVTVPADLAERVAVLLRRRCLDLLGLARRGGTVAAGFEQVKERLAAGGVGVLLEAADGAAGGRGKIRAIAGETPVIELFTAAELGQALGREHAVHVALDAGALTAKLRREAARLAAIETSEDHPAAA